MELMLKDKVAIVTGSGGTGMGRQIALTLAEEGAKVAVTDVLEDGIEATVREIKERGGQAMAAAADVKDLDSVRRMAEAVTRQWGTIHILVNHAGGDIHERFVDSKPENWRHIVDLNYFGVLNCVSVVLPIMIGQRYGKIVSTMSDAGRVGEPSESVYSGAKAAIGAFTKALAKENGRFCVNANCVLPSMTPNPARQGQQTEAELERLQRVQRLYPMGRGLNRLGIPSDVANMVTFLASDRAQWVTGQLISVNGGYAM